MIIAASAGGAFLIATTVNAAGPENWQTGFAVPASEIKVRIIALHQHIISIGVAILLTVTCLIGFVLVRFNEERNPTPQALGRAPWLEFAWTVLPVAILSAIAAPSLRLLDYQSQIPDAAMTVKVTGHQWFWRFSYADHESISFDSVMLPPEGLAPGQPRLLEPDNRLVVPVGKAVRIQVTAADVVHSFFVPALGVQIYAIPGRLNETWTRIDRPGVYYGQCNQICGLNHAFMPIAIEAKPAPDFDAWIAARTMNPRGMVR